MSDYKRLISYVYMYQKNQKGKNVGFVKLETSNGQCKIGVSLKGLFTGNMDMDVLMFAYQKEISMGKIYIRGGQGELRVTTDQENLSGSGIPFSEMGGLMVRGRALPDTYYATIWDDDLVAEPKEEILAEQELVAAEVLAYEEPIEQTEDLYIFSSTDEELNKVYSDENLVVFPKSRATSGQVMEDIVDELMGELSQEIEAELSGEHMAVQREEVKEAAKIDQDKMVLQREETESNVPYMEDKEQYPDIKEEELSEEEQKMQEAYQAIEEADDDYIYPPELEPEMPKDLWDILENKFPKARCFASERPHEILSIQPQDIGLLPREVWVFGNNSFLLHGYYQYRYLIVVKMKMEDERNKYLLGIPGVYHNNERFMATMFGFPSFFLAKKQSAKMGQFGYWCTEIKIT